MLFRYVRALPAHDELRTEMRGLGCDEIILAQSRYEHENEARPRRGDFFSQVVADLDEASPLLPRPTSSPLEQEVATSRKHRGYFAFIIWSYVWCAEWKNHTLQMHWFLLLSSSQSLRVSVAT